MLQLWTMITIAIGVLSLFGTLFYSIQSHRSKGLRQAIYRAWMNLFMGTLFVAIAGHLATFQVPTLGYVLIGIIAFLGLINLYYGWKNRKYYTELLLNQNQKEPSSPTSSASE